MRDRLWVASFGSVRTGPDASPASSHVYGEGKLCSMKQAVVRACCCCAAVLRTLELSVGRGAPYALLRALPAEILRLGD